MVGQERCKVRTVDVTFEAGLPFIYIYIFMLNIISQEHLRTGLGEKTWSLFTFLKPVRGTCRELDWYSFVAASRR